MPAHDVDALPTRPAPVRAASTVQAHTSLHPRRQDAALRARLAVRSSLPQGLVPSVLSARRAPRSMGCTVRVAELAAASRACHLQHHPVALVLWLAPELTLGALASLRLVLQARESVVLRDGPRIEPLRDVVLERDSFAAVAPEARTAKLANTPFNYPRSEMLPKTSSATTVRMCAAPSECSTLHRWVGIEADDTFEYSRCWR